MQTNIVSLIFLLVFLKHVASQPKLFVVDLINKGSDDDRQIKLNEALKLIRDEHHHKLQKIIFRDLDKFDETDKGVKFANNDAFDFDEPELNYDEQETFKVDNCRSLRPKDIRECLEHNIKKIKGQSDKIEMGGEPDVFENFKTPDECLALEATVFVQLECLAKFKILPMDYTIIKNSEPEEDEFVNVRDPEDCWKLKNTRMSRKLICLKLFYKKNLEIDDEEFKNLNDPNDCLFLKKTTMQRKLKCLEIVEKKNDPEVVTKYDNFENIKDPNECLLLKKATMENKLKCLEKFEKKKDKIVDPKYIVVDNTLENVKDPTDCLSLKTTIKNKYKCLDQFGKANDEDYDVAFISDEFDNLKDPNDCLFLKETIEIKLKCLDKFQKVEEIANQKAKEMTIPTADENPLRTEDNKVIKGPEDCLFAHTTYGKKLKCLDQFEKLKENIRSRGIEPNHLSSLIATRPKRKIYSLYNYYNALIKPAGFKDLTRQEFSQDYLDISELSRSIPKCRTPQCNVDLLKLSYQLKEKKADLKNNSRRIFDSVHTRYIQADSDDDSDEIETPKPKKKKVQKKKNGVPIRFTVVSKEERPYDSESDEHRNLKAEVNGVSFEEKQYSDEEHQNLKKKKQNGVSFEEKQDSDEEHQNLKKKKQNGVSFEEKQDSDEEHQNLKKKKQNGVSFEEKQDSDEEHQNLKKKKQSPKKKQKSSAEEKPKKSFLLFESEENVNKGISSESVSLKKSFVKNKKKAKKSHVNDDYSIETERPSSFKYSYIQGNKIVDFFRRRLEHFLPKRFHWDETDFKNLGYHWYDGPRGRWSK